MSSTLPCLCPQVKGQSFLAVLTPPVGRVRSFLPGSISVSIETLDCVQIAAAPEAAEMKRADELHLSHSTPLRGHSDVTHQATAASLSAVQEGGKVFEQLRPRPQNAAYSVIQDINCSS